MAYVNKNSSFVLIFALLLSTIVIEACPTCAPTKKPPPPPPASSTTPCPPPPPSSTKKPSPPTPSTPSSCPRDALKLGVCANLLGLGAIVIGSPSSGSKCCALLKGLADLDAAVCLCTAIKANVLGIKLDIPVFLSLLLNACNKKLPSGYTCK